MTSGASPVKIRTASEQDGPAIAALFTGVFGKGMSFEQWRWKYRLNSLLPLCSAIAATAGGDIVGHVGAIPLSGSDHGKALFAWQLSDAMVHADYRGKNLFPELLLHVGRSVDSLHSEAVCYAFAGPESTRIGISKGILLDKAKISCYSLDAANPLPRSIGWSLEPTTFGDERLPELWEKYSSGLDVFTKRDSEYLNWRYAASPFHRYRVALVRHLFRTAGWLIWSEEGDGLKLIDLCVDRRHVKAVLSLAFRRLSRGGKISFWLPASLVKGIDMGLTSEETLIHLMFLNHRPAVSPPAGADKDFYFTMGDVDIY